MKKIFTLFCFIYFTSTRAQTFFKAYHVGHSLVNVDMPFQLSESRKLSASPNYSYRHHINIGSSIKANWITTTFNSNPIWDPGAGQDVEYGTNHMAELPLGGYNAIVVTEAIPLLVQNGDTTLKYVENFFKLAIANNPGIKTYLYQIWEFVPNGGTDYAAWRTTITTLQPTWEKYADSLAKRTGQFCYLVPAAKALAALYDTLQIHPVGAITNISQLFVDDAHLSNTGNYLVAMVHYAALFGSSPEGLPAVKAGPYQTPFVITDNATRTAIQQLAWNVVCDYSSYTGINCLSTGIEETTFQDDFTFYYNLSNHTLYFDQPVTVKILDINGRSVIEDKAESSQSIDISALSAGMYFIQNQEGTIKKLIKN